MAENSKLLTNDGRSTPETKLKVLRNNKLHYLYNKEGLIATNLIKKDFTGLGEGI